MRVVFSIVTRKDSNMEDFFFFCSTQIPMDTSDVHVVAWSTGGVTNQRVYLFDAAYFHFIQSSKQESIILKSGVPNETSQPNAVERHF